MALSKRSIYNTKELTKCPICSSDLCCPKLLPCLHSFCLRCIKNYCKNDSPGDEVRCPACSGSFHIPGGGVEQLVSNGFLEDLIEVKQEVGESSNSTPCDVCAEFNDDKHFQVPSATVLCTCCGQKLCTPCSRPHSKIIGGAHQVVPIDSVDKNDLWRLKNSFCSEHTGNKLELHCTKCQVNLCLVCLATVHEGHERQSINAMHTIHCESLKSDLKRVAESESSILQEINRLGLAEKQHVNEIEQVERELLKIANELKKRVDETVDQLMQKLSEDKITAFNVSREVKVRLDMMLAEMQSFKAYSTELVDKGRPWDVTQAYKDLHSRAETLLKYDLKTVSCNLPKIDTTANDIVESLSRIIMPSAHWQHTEENKKEEKTPDAGPGATDTPHWQHLEEKRVVDKTQVARLAMANTLERIHSTEEDIVIWGLTSLGNELFVGYQLIDVIKVFDTESYNVKRNVQILGLGAVNDMTSSERLRCVYVADCGNKVIHRVSNDNIMTQWPVTDVPHGLSVNAADNVMVTCIEVSEIKEFTTDGNLIRVIKLPSDIIHPSHTIQLTNDQFLISHGNAKDSLHRVCVVDSSGCLVQSFGGSRGRNSIQLNTPIRMAVSGVILVADLNNHRIVMLSPKLRFIRTVVSGLRGPCRMWFDEQTGRLYVADNKWEKKKFVIGQLKVFCV